MTMNKKEMVLKQQTQEKEIDLHPGEAMEQTERDLQLSTKSRSISGVYHKDHRKSHQGHRTLTQLKKKLANYLQELLKQKKRPQDITTEKTLEKVLELWDHCQNCDLWLNK